MNKIKFNHTSLTVSPVCLGTVNYGTDMSEQDAKAQISKFLSTGGNFVDTAHIYGDWGDGPKCISERVIGKWIGQIVTNTATITIVQ